jgi:multicomponent Na+:H+ antiporter subunit E
MNPLLLNILLALAWVALTGQFTSVNFFIGFALGALMVRLAPRTVGTPKYFSKIRQVIRFAVYYLWELTKANLQVAYEVLTPRFNMRPGVVAVPLEAQTDEEITLLVNLITLTPGTLVLDISADHRVMYIHEMYLHEDIDQFRRGIKARFEQRVLEVLR